MNITADPFMKFNIIIDHFMKPNTAFLISSEMFKDNLEIRSWLKNALANYFKAEWFIESDNEYIL